ncbi:MAG: ATP-binding protein [Ignavibacteriaceae bacterium]|nr:ATP-binding protein [Ignavibacteriaceae bacterium]
MKTVNPKSYELQVKSTTENLSLIRDFIQNNALKRGVPQHIIDKIILAVDEASTNIIKHAYHSKPDGDIIIQLEFSFDKCRIILIDFGDGFNPSVIPQPDMPEYFEKRKVGGLGLHLIRTLMDYVEYHTDKGGYNQLTIAKKIKNSAA